MGRSLDVHLRCWLIGRFWQQLFTNFLFDFYGNIRVVFQELTRITLPLTYPFVIMVIPGTGFIVDKAQINAQIH